MQDLTKIQMLHLREIYATFSDLKTLKILRIKRGNGNRKTKKKPEILRKITSVINRFVKKGRVDSILLDSTQKNFILYYEPTRVVYY